jgi:hypothetical protein
MQFADDRHKAVVFILGHAIEADGVPLVQESA